MNHMTKRRRKRQIIQTIANKKVHFGSEILNVHKLLIGVIYILDLIFEIIWVLHGRCNFVKYVVNKKLKSQTL